jgi:hypothetical protein
MDAQGFEKKQWELAAEFGKFVFDHPEVEAVLPEGAHVCFQKGVSGRAPEVGQGQALWSAALFGRVGEGTGFPRAGQGVCQG